MQDYPAHYYPQDNPGRGAAAAGAAAGALLGAIATAGAMVAVVGRSGMTGMSQIAQTETPEDSMAASMAATDELLKKARIVSIVGGVASIGMSAAGAHWGAPEGSKRQAAIGAGVGTGVMKLGGMFVPWLQLPGIGTGAIGAAVGAGM